MLDTLSRTLKTARAKRLRLMSPHREMLGDMPPELYDYWSRTAHLEFKGIPRDAFFYARAAEALLTFFDCVASTSRPCGLPSKAADSVWHAWLRYSPASLDDFCERHFRTRIPHVEAAAMSGGMARAIARTLVEARRQDGLALAGPNVPRLFRTDRALRMPGGFAYDYNGAQMTWAQIDARGRAQPAGPLRATDPSSLLAAGLITRTDYERFRKLYRWGGDYRPGDGPTGGAAADGAGCDDGSSCGSQCGSSCGGSCGSGCGGGCGGGGGD
ncbi:hypothetical protein OU994_06185 [Pseudoduganella sp. SL102]|uniref:hypothetical protein n=1 Tax=Pseudoduganella sp. SL102 TaxID=2995154 RepID=UPI00248AAB80|nr:hypothetical protein [Pseudoduganella sp. SL102]WBS03874.1 hypothetical protein OU994_06185 [Pseudoduganella sp. SL102]